MERPKRSINLDNRNQIHNTVIDTATIIYQNYFAGNEKKNSLTFAYSKLFHWKLVF